MIAYVCLARTHILNNAERFARDDVDWGFINAMLYDGHFTQSDYKSALSDTYIELGEFQFSSILPYDDLLEGEKDETFGLVDYYIVVQSFFCCSTFGVNVQNKRYKFKAYTLLQDEMAKEIFIRAFTRIGVSYGYVNTFYVKGNRIDFMPTTDKKVDDIVNELKEYTGTYVAYLILRTKEKE